VRVFYRSRPAKRSLLGAPAVVYQQGPVRFCCAAMCERWGSVIGFGARGCAASTSRDVNLFTDRPQVGGGAVLLLTGICFCPWCGEAVETCRVK
jgi:hypothetical protein